MKWFSINGIIKETKRVRWPRPKALFKDSAIVVVFVIILGIFFYVCQAISSGFLSLIGI